MVCQLERALKLAQEGRLDVIVNEPEAQEAQVDVHPTRGIRTNRKQPRTLNQATGKMSTKDSAFSHHNWGGQTGSYQLSIAKRSDKVLGDIVAETLMYLATNRDDEALCASVIAPDVLDPRAQMCKYFSPFKSLLRGQDDNILV